MVDQKNEIKNALSLPFELVKAARPLHWIKNLALFAALIFTGTLLIESYFATVVWAFVSFSLATSAVYIFNDIQDVKKDRLHPIKKNRPIASGRISISVAAITSLVLAVSSLYWAIVLNDLFFFIVLAYLILQILYSLGLKNMAIIDILIIATGFVIRVYAGAFVINAHLSVWFLLCVVSVSLFLASGKRRAELSIARYGETRESLTKYKRELLNSYVTMFGNAAWMSWSLFTFFESPSADINIWLFFAEISKATTFSKLLMATIPVVIFIIMRYEHLIFEDRTESPERIFLTDKALIISIGIYILMVLAILYGGVTTI
jgi:4-hydroxybenzoate polyprenyltransferase